MRTGEGSTNPGILAGLDSLEQDFGCVVYRVYRVLG